MAEALLALTEKPTPALPFVSARSPILVIPKSAQRLSGSLDHRGGAAGPVTFLGSELTSQQDGAKP